MSPVITYRYFDSPEQEQQARAAVEANLRYVPWWCERIAVMRSYGDDEDVAANVQCQQNYRQIAIRVFHLFFDAAADVRERYMRHELCHAILAPLTTWLCDVVIAPMQESNPQLHAVLEHEANERVESVVQDLSVTWGMGEPLVDALVDAPPPVGWPHGAEVPVL